MIIGALTRGPLKGSQEINFVVGRISGVEMNQHAVLRWGLYLLLGDAMDGEKEGSLLRGKIKRKLGI